MADNYLSEFGEQHSVKDYQDSFIRAVVRSMGGGWRAQKVEATQWRDRVRIKFSNGMYVTGWLEISDHVMLDYAVGRSPEIPWIVAKEIANRIMHEMFPGLDKPPQHNGG